MRISRVLGLTLLTMPLVALAGDSLDVKLGLWEVTFSSDVHGSMVPASVLEKMPPAQRASLEASLKARAASQSKPRIHKSCVKAEDVKNGAFRASDDQDNRQCKTTITAQTRTLQEATVVCTGEASRTSHMRVEMQGREHVKGSIENIMERGKVNVQFSGRWLGESCAGSDDEE